MKEKGLGKNVEKGISINKYEKVSANDCKVGDNSRRRWRFERPIEGFGGCHQRTPSNLGGTEV